MADLKKENFSLKLKIYYLETTLSKVSGTEEFDVLTEVSIMTLNYVTVQLLLLLISFVNEGPWILK